ncbi:hypothetical protein Tcan_11446 [Toxocara canis]|uniref:Uncharacterized protein n=1 Tax=Toxocara canis TaxID=6265 RepID=A0A0B2VTI4_TOXCA|nr:hypothetical protein Tcan_11446 [Toxocara canis]
MLSRWLAAHSSVCALLSMSSTASGHSTQQSDSAQLSSHSSTRKRASPNTGGGRKELQSTTSIAAVGSSSSKLRKLSHPAVSQEGGSSGLPRSEGSESAGPSGSSGGAHHSGHEGGLRGELRYLTDFFPEQSPSDRRLTRSQRQLSAPSSPAFSATETIEDSTPPSNIPSPAPQSSAGREKIRGRKGRGKAAAGGESVRASGEHTQPGPSSSGRSRSQYNATTGLCNSIARCDVNRVFPSAGTSALHHDEGGSRSAPQLSIVPQNDNGVIVAPSSLGVANAHDDVMGVGNSSSTAGPSVNVTSSGAAHVYSAGGDTHSLDAHTAQIRNMQRTCFPAIALLSDRWKYLKHFHRSAIWQASQSGSILEAEDDPGSQIISTAFH